MNQIPAQWIFSSDITSFDFYLSLDNGSSWVLLSSNVSGSLPPYNTYNNIMPTLTQTQNAALLKVVNHNNTSVFSVSPNVFSLQYTTLSNANILLSYADGSYTTVNWDTLVASRSQVFYGKDPNNLSSSSIKDVSFQTSHAHILFGLDPYHLYYYNIRSDTDFELAESSGSFQYFPTGPLEFIGYGVKEVTSNFVVIDSVTNQYAYTQIGYGTGSATEKFTQVYPMSLVSEITIPNLGINTSYYFQINCTRPSASLSDIGSIQSLIMQILTPGSITIEDILTNPGNLITMETINSSLTVISTPFNSATYGTNTPNADETAFSVSPQPMQVATSSVPLTPPSAAIIGTEITYTVA